MAKRETRDEAVARASRAERDSFANWFVMRALLQNEAPQFDRSVSGEHSFGNEQCTLRVRAWGLQRADGGYMLVEYLSRENAKPSDPQPRAYSVLDWTARLEHQACISEIDWRMRECARALYAAMVAIAKQAG